jgi:hypothetical protein
LPFYTYCKYHHELSLYSSMTHVLGSRPVEWVQKPSSTIFSIVFTSLPRKDVAPLRISIGCVSTSLLLKCSRLTDHRGRVACMTHSDWMSTKMGSRPLAILNTRRSRRQSKSGCHPVWHTLPSRQVIFGSSSSLDRLRERIRRRTALADAEDLD